MPIRGALNEFPVPQGVRTAVTLHELHLLQRYAAGRRVLEIGTHLGFTCIGMALAGAQVISYDPHYEGPADNPDTWQPFIDNCARNLGPVYHPVSTNTFWCGQSVTAYRRPIEQYRDPELRGRNEEGIELAFIDGNHIWPYPMRDADIARVYLRPPGYLAFHDVTPNWPGVWRTVNELVDTGQVVKLEQVGTLAVYQVSGHTSRAPNESSDTSKAD